MTRRSGINPCGKVGFPSRAVLRPTAEIRRWHVRPPPPWEACRQGILNALEALVTVNQAGTEGTGSFQLRCDGRWHSTEASVIAIDFLFQPGHATSSAFLLVLDPGTGETAQSQDGRTLLLR